MYGRLVRRTRRTPIRRRRMVRSAPRRQIRVRRGYTRRRATLVSRRRR